jgi:type II secretory pathway pseudopilin PulG
MNRAPSRILSRMRLKAHTLIEMVAIITILGILAAVIVPRIQNISLTAKTNATQKEMVELQKAIMGDGDYRGYYEDNDSLPANLSDLYGIQEAGYNPFLQTGGRRGTYISDADVDGDGTADILQDAWGTAYGWDSGTGVITSGGPDLAIGGGDDITVDVDG